MLLNIIMHFFRPMRLYEIGKLHDELIELYMSRVMRALALSLIGVFIPIFLLETGFSLQHVLLFLILNFAFFAFFSPLASIIETKIGNKHTIAIGLPTMIVFFILLFSLQQFWWPLPMLSMVYGLAMALYWVPFNSYFTVYTDRRHRGQNIGMLTAIPRMTSAIAPLLGGFAIVGYGFGVLLLVGCVLLFMSLVPLFFTKDHKVKINYTWTKTFSSKNRLFFKEFLVKGMLAASITLWSIYVFFVHTEYMFVAISTTITGIAAALFTFVIGRLSDRVDKNTLLFIGGILNCFAWAYAAFAITDFDVYFLSFLLGFAYIMIAIPLFTFACDAAVKQNIPQFFTMREMTFCISHVIIFSVAVIVPFEYTFKAAFILTAVVSLYFAMPGRLPKQKKRSRYR